MVDYLTLGTGAVGGLVSAGLLKAPMETISDIWYVVFGHKISAKADEVRLTQAINLQKLKNSLEAEINKIDEKNLQIPKVSIVGPALEASKFYIEEDDIRDMFAKIISSSMDKSKSPYLHHSFVEIVKMLSPLDAQNLSYIFKNKDRAIVNLKYMFKLGGHRHVRKHIYLGNPEIKDLDSIRPSIENLIRLKLLDVTYSEWINDERQYDKFKETDLYTNLTQSISTENHQLQEILNVIETNNITYHDQSTALDVDYLKSTLEKGIIERLEVEKGILELTAFGQNFCTICL